MLIDFINKVLPDKNVKYIEYLPRNIVSDVWIKKQSIVDILFTDENGSKYIIEMKNSKKKVLKRELFIMLLKYAWHNG